LRRIATVTFEPVQKGTVVKYSILKISPEGGTKTVTLDAQVRTPDGHIRPEKLVVVMQTGGPTGWTITGVAEAH
jgi:hypothetical protein